MDQSETSEKAWEHGKEQKLFFEGRKQEYIELFDQVYAMGFDKGRKIMSHSKKVMQLDKYGNVIKEYDSVTDASRTTKIDKSNISKVCRGISNEAGGFHWRYKT